MKWFKEKILRKSKDLPVIDKISTDMIAVYQNMDAFNLPSWFSLNKSDTLPVIDQYDNIVGIVSEYDLAKILPEWSLEQDSYQHKIKVKDIMTKDVWVEYKNTNVSELFSTLHEMHTRVIPIIDRNNKYTGKCITRSEVVSYLTRMVKPYSLGGLATPLGVYITDGKHQAGAGNLGLFLTGVTFSSFVILINFINEMLFNFNNNVSNIFILLFNIMLFLIIVRITPFAKIHAAEHQTINAIEKGLPLEVDIVKKQPRFHKRCGTNLMVLIMGIFFILMLPEQFPILRSSSLGFLFSFILFLFLFSNWRKMGIYLQKKLTTAKAPEKYITNGINVGREILLKHKNDTSPKKPNFFVKVWNVGFIQLLTGFYGFYFIYNYIVSHTMVK